jgi:hypothetical protein
LLQGTGYGMDVDWRHGMWQGPDVKVEGRVWDLADPAVRSGLIGLLENVATAKQSSGPDGMGMLEFACVGPHDKYGFEGWEDLGLVPPD